MKRWHEETNHMARQKEISKMYDGPFEGNPAYDNVIYRRRKENYRKMKAMACRCKSGCGCKYEKCSNEYRSIQDRAADISYKEMLND